MTAGPPEGRRLIVGRIGETFDPTRDIPLGIWCFSGREAVYPGWENLELFDPFEDRCSQEAEGPHACRLSEHLLHRLAAQLNNRHGRDYSISFWRILLMPWLFAILKIAWYRFLHVQKFVERFGGGPLTGLLRVGDAPWVFQTTDECVTNATYNPHFEEWLSGIMLDRLAPETWHLERAFFSMPPREDISRYVDPPLVPTWRHRIARRLARWLRFNNVPGTRFSKFLFSVLLSIRPPHRATTRLAPVAEPDPAPHFPPVFLHLLEQILSLTLPTAFGDEFPRYERLAAKGRFRQGRITVGVRSFYNEEERFGAALAWEAGERHFQVQHGGNYGILRAMTDAAHLEYVEEGFITWGWRGHQNYPGNFIPLPSPLLGRLRDRHRFLRPRLILVGTTIRFPYFHFDWEPQPTQWLTNRKAKEAFFRDLDPAIFSQAAYRPYLRVKPVLEDENYFRARFPALHILTSDLEAAMLECRLLVLDHPGTTLNIAMAANVPTLCFWDQETWPECRQARTCLEALRQAGLLFDTAQAAAAQANRIWADVEAWWRQPEVQAARQGFVEHYAVADRWWWWKWLKTLARL